MNAAAVGLTVPAGLAGAVQVAVKGRFVMGVAIDRFGLFGVEQIGISWPRALGIVLLAVGAALSLAR